MNRIIFLTIVVGVFIVSNTVKCCAQDFYVMKLIAFPYGDGLVYSLNPKNISKVSTLDLKITKTPWSIEFEDFLDSIRIISTSTSEIEQKKISNMDFRLRIVIQHKYIFWIRHVIYCDRFGHFLYKGRLFKSDSLHSLIKECVPPFID